MFTGSYAVNPINGDEIPVWIADYVLMGYGTGAIMARAVRRPARLRVRPQVRSADPGHPAAAAALVRRAPASSRRSTRRRGPAPSSATPPYVNSANASLDLDGIDNKGEGVRLTNEWLEANGHGEATITYKLRDWLFSRQRYWGEPFPIVYDADGNPHALPDEMLPVELPETDSFSPRTFDADDEFSNPESPLDRLPEWVNVTLDLGDGPQPYRRDTNVMPQWAGSCWYQLRYLDPTNDEVFVDPEVEAYWTGPRTDQRPDHPGGVDLYVGGVEHAVLHLLYARFWHKVLFDLGHLSSKEPYARLFNQGYVLAAAYKDEREIYVDALDVERARRAVLLRGRAGHPRDGQDGQEPQERRLARRPVRRLRRRHAAPVPDGDWADGCVAAVGDTRRGRACTASCSGCGARSSTSRPASAASSTSSPTSTPRACCIGRSMSSAPRWMRCASTPRSPS